MRQRESGEVIFIERTPRGLKKWLLRHAKDTETSMTRAAVAILQSARKADQRRRAAKK